MQKINSRRWHSVLNQSNLQDVIAFLRDFCKDGVIIVYIQNCDHALPNGEARPEVRPGCIREDPYDKGGKWVYEDFHVGEDENGSGFLMFSAGGYVNMWHYASGNTSDSQDGRYSHIEIENGILTQTERAIAGKGYLHKAVLIPMSVAQVASEMAK